MKKILPADFATFSGHKKTAPQALRPPRRIMFFYSCLSHTGIGGGAEGVELGTYGV